MKDSLKNRKRLRLYKRCNKCLGFQKLLAHLLGLLPIYTRKLGNPSSSVFQGEYSFLESKLGK